MTRAGTRSRHGLNAVMAHVNLRGLRAIDRRTAAARDMLAFRAELIAALGGEDQLSPQRRKLVDLAARVALYVDHVDGWLAEQRSLINRRSRSLLPVLAQRQALAEHLARLLDRLGLDRVAQKVPDLRTYLAEKYAADSAPHGTNGGSGHPHPAPGADDASERQPGAGGGGS